MIKQCIQCYDKFETTNQKRKFCAVRCKNKYNDSNSYLQQQNRALERKQYFIQKAGGKCIKCGYNKNTAALSFHHRIPSMKSFQLDARNMSNRKKSDLESEFQKCDLLCLNCHAETHHPQRELT